MRTGAAPTAHIPAWRKSSRTWRCRRHRRPIPLTAARRPPGNARRTPEMYTGQLKRSSQQEICWPIATPGPERRSIGERLRRRLTSCLLTRTPMGCYTSISQKAPISAFTASRRLQPWQPLSDAICGTGENVPGTSSPWRWTPPDFEGWRPRTVDGSGKAATWWWIKRTHQSPG